LPDLADTTLERLRADLFPPVINPARWENGWRDRRASRSFGAHLREFQRRHPVQPSTSLVMGCASSERHQASGVLLPLRSLLGISRALRRPTPTRRRARHGSSSAHRRGAPCSFDTYCTSGSRPSERGLLGPSSAWPWPAAPYTRDRRVQVSSRHASWLGRTLCVSPVTWT